MINSKILRSITMIRQFYLEPDDNTYYYGGELFEAEYNPETDELYEPYVRKASKSKTVKFYPSKNLFVVYVNNIIKEIICLMTCWSDDFRAYKLDDKKIASSYRECYHGRRKINPVPCNIDFTEFIRDNDLEMKV
jgi:hypothetical protein